MDESGYDYSFDIWSFGCLLYEIVVGHPPFGSTKIAPAKLRKMVLTEEFKVKDYFSKDFCDLLFKILEKNPNKRLTIEQIKAHPFFKKVDWAQVASMKGLKPPLKPKVDKNCKKFNLKFLKELKRDALGLEDMQDPNYYVKIDQQLFKKFTYIKKDNSLFVKSGTNVGCT